MCGFIYKADSYHSLKGKSVFSADDCNIGLVVSSLGNILIIEQKFKQEIGENRKNKKVWNSSNRNKKDRGTIYYS